MKKEEINSLTVEELLEKLENGYLEHVKNGQYWCRACGEWHETNGSTYGCFVNGPLQEHPYRIFDDFVTWLSDSCTILSSSYSYPCENSFDKNIKIPNEDIW